MSNGYGGWPISSSINLFAECLSLVCSQHLFLQSLALYLLASYIYVGYEV